jgi:RHH-type transcriptional regulator, proline utilization regulon repressor / proline dehydrogenase / delta 1-pyrroline-5-carboxylate dehydrogenase
MGIRIADGPIVRAAEAAARDAALTDHAVALARRLLVAGEAQLTRRERRQRERLGRLIADPDGRELLFELTDQVLRIDDRSRAARRLAGIVSRHPPDALGPVDGTLLRTAALVAPLLPAVVMPLVERRIVAETRGVVLPADDPAFARHVARRAEQGVHLNINPLGEAILSDAEADARLGTILDRIRRPDVDYVSLKISAVVAHLDPFAFEHSVEQIRDRLRTVFRTAQAARPATFVNLDMEEYRDLELSLESFMRVLDEPELESIDAGIVLQAYLPDSHAALERLGWWATTRRERGGGRVKVRIVKGANLAMERVESELHGWEPAPYATKAEVDASFKAMLDSALRRAWVDSVRVGVASHNVFDVAWALVTARATGAVARVDVEMLEGMAPAQARAVLDEAGDLLLYAPVVARRDVDASIAYLSRRLDENTQPENFLRAMFDLQLDSRAWREQEARFRAAVEARHGVARRGRRRPLPGSDEGVFRNEPDTDPTDPAMREWITGAPTPTPWIEPVLDEATVDAVVDRAHAAFAAWTARSSNERRRVIRGAAAAMRAHRHEIVRAMVDETGKTVREGDPEVSEAIDFAEYYAGPGIELLDALRDDGLAVTGRGIVVVVAPWNFPYAIPAGGVLAALAGGNAVILKPAPESVRVAAAFVALLHRAGVPREAVQLVVCEDGPIGRRLVTHPRVDTVVLTGSWATAELFRSWRPDLRLFAETSGKNSLVITAAADLDLAIADLVRSAFGHAGQKCSAASLAIVEAPVHDDPSFLPRLRQVVESWRVGWPSDPAAMIGPVISPPSGPLQRALTTLEPGESWLVEPGPLDESGRLWSPGVRVGVQPGSWFHRTECFGPVLGVIRADDLDHAIAIQNDSEYGLTGGIHSLDPAEVATWVERVQVGNAYVNKGTTGAVVQRQPFGGWRRSSVGPGAKAGGPSYVLQFAKTAERAAWPTGQVRASYAAAWREEFSVEHDPSGLRSESNVLRYLPVDRVVARHDGGQDESLARLRLAADVSGVELVESDARTVGDAALVTSLRSTDRVRVLIEPDDSLLRSLIDSGVWFDTSLPGPHGRVELLKWVREQCVSHTRHRHGRLPDTYDGAGSTDVDPRERAMRVSVAPVRRRRR